MDNLNKMVTPIDIMANGPCSIWTKRKIQKCIGKEMTLLEILDLQKLEEVSLQDRI